MTHSPPSPRQPDSFRAQTALLLKNKFLNFKEHSALVFGGSRTLCLILYEVVDRRVDGTSSWELPVLTVGILRGLEPWHSYKRILMSWGTQFFPSLARPVPKYSAYLLGNLEIVVWNGLTSAHPPTKLNRPICEPEQEMYMTKQTLCRFGDFRFLLQWK